MSPSEELTRAASRITDLCDEPIETAVVLGSGLHLFAEQLEATERIPYSELPGFPTTTAFGHRGEFLVGRWQDLPLLALNGRIHLYEGHSVETICLPIQVCHAAGIKRLIISNASGGLNPQFKSGDVMLIDSHLDLTFQKPPANHPNAGVRNSSVHRTSRIRNDIYCPAWKKSLLELSLRNGSPIQSGIYVGLVGPNYETRSEYRFLRKIGGDAVGMSTVWEASMAAALGMQVIGLSVITNVANPDRPATTSAQEVIDLAALAEQRMEQLMNWLLPKHHPNFS